jgi:hypothetical protein
MTGQLKLNVEPFLAVLGIKIPQTSSLQRSYCFAVISQSVDLNKKGYDLDRIPYKQQLFTKGCLLVDGTTKTQVNSCLIIQSFT